MYTIIFTVPSSVYVSPFLLGLFHGRRPRRGWGDGPQNLRWGRPMHPSPNFWGSSVIASMRTEKNGNLCVCVCVHV